MKTSTLFFIIVMCGMSVLLGVVIGKSDNQHYRQLIEVTPNTGQSGYQIMYKDGDQLKYAYPITENGKNNFLKAFGFVEDEE